MKKRSILICEDEEVIRETLAEFLEGEDYQVTAVGTVGEALSLVKSRDFQVAICDIQLPDGDGVKLLRQIHQINPHTFVLIITAYASVESSVAAFKQGAFDYLVKPVRFEDLEVKLSRVFQHRDLFVENQTLRRELARVTADDRIVGSGKAAQRLRTEIANAALTGSSLLIEGPGGAGKELAARVIHQEGPQGGESFVVLSCDRDDPERLEDELFGDGDTDGLLADLGSGTLLLKSIERLPRDLQKRLLTMLERGEVRSPGSKSPIPIEARIIASTSAELSAEVAAGRFDESLFFRLNGTKITVPSLADRIDDLPELVEHFVGRHSEQMGKRVSGASSEAIRLLLAADYPGNVRQLDNAVQRAVMHSTESLLEPADFPSELAGLTQPPPDADDLRSALRHYERLHIQRVLKQCPDKRTAAKRLKLGLSSLYRKIEELGIET